MNEEKTTPKQMLRIATGQVKKFFQNRDVLKWVIIGLAGFVILVLVFGAGVKVGTLKARYSYRWADNYHKNFAGPRGGFLGDWQRFPAGDFIANLQPVLNRFSTFCDCSVFSGNDHFFYILAALDQKAVVFDFNNFSERAVTADKATGRESLPITQESAAGASEVFMIIIRPTIRVSGLERTDLNAGAENQDKNHETGESDNDPFKNIAILKEFFYLPRCDAKHLLRGCFFFIHISKLIVPCVGDSRPAISFCKETDAR